MNIEICDLCKNKESNKRFKVKMSRKGYYQRTGYGIRWTDMWKPYERISICEDCAEKLLNIKLLKHSEAIMGYMTAYDVTNSIIDEVEEQPTAYDVDKVVEELEELKMQAKKDMQLSDNIADANAYGGKMIAYDVAIDIVRKGGSKNE